jgi:prepilin-type N-terminal cleavage/methylation domain-containing protein
MRRKGFTLLELIVATLIFTVVISAAYSLFASARGLTVSAEARAELFQTARAAIQAIEDDVRGAVMSGSAFDTGFVGTDVGSPTEPLDTIDLVAVNTHAMNLAQDQTALISANPIDRKIDLSRVSYWIEPGNGAYKARGLVRQRQKLLTSPTLVVPSDDTVEEVSADVIFLNFRYYDYKTGWQDSWDSTQVNYLPQAVEVTVYVKGQDRGQDLVEKFTSRFYLAVGAQTPAKKKP